MGRHYLSGKGVTKDGAEAVKWLSKAAEQGHLGAPFNLGMMYDGGIEVAEDKAKAVKWYRLVAEHEVIKSNKFDVMFARYRLAECYRDGTGVEKNLEDAVGWYRKAAEGEKGAVCAEAQYNLGVCYANGEGVVQDNAEAFKWYEKAAEQGHVEAEYKLGDCYMTGLGTEIDYAEAVKCFRKVAEADRYMYKDLRGLAMKRVSDCYLQGKGVEKDWIEGVKWRIRPVSEERDSKKRDSKSGRGSIFAYTVWIAILLASIFNRNLSFDNIGGQSETSVEGICAIVAFIISFFVFTDGDGHYNLGIFFGVPACLYIILIIKGLLFVKLRWKANSGDPDAILKVAHHYAETKGGDGTETVDWYRKAAASGKVEAVEWFRNAAEMGRSVAQFNLGACYANGYGVEMDVVEAVKWYRKAAEQGLVDAQFCMGDCYENGDGVEKDATEAINWYRRAAELGHVVAQERLKSLGVTITAERMTYKEFIRRYKREIIIFLLGVASPVIVGIVLRCTENMVGFINLIGFIGLLVCWINVFGFKWFWSVLVCGVIVYGLILSAIVR